MKTLLSIFAVILFAGCSIQKQLPDETQYLTLNQIKRDYQLTNKQRDAIAKTDTIKSKWFGAIDLRVYDANENYSVFKK